MGSTISKSNNDNDVINEQKIVCNQTRLTDLLWRKIISLLSNDRCRYHRCRWNPLSLSLVSHYWLVNIVARAPLRITTADSKSQFLLNFHKSYRRSFINLYKTNNNNNNNNSNSNSNNNNNNNNNILEIDRKFNIIKLTVIFNHSDFQLKFVSMPFRENRKLYNRHLWLEMYNDALIRYWSFDSLTLVNPPRNFEPEKLLVAAQLRTLRIYHENPRAIDMSAFQNVVTFSLRQNNQATKSLSFTIPNKSSLLTSLSLTIPFKSNNNNNNNNDINRYPFKDNSFQPWFEGVTKLELNHIHITEWKNVASEHINIDFTKQFANLTSLKLNHIYHRLVNTLHSNSIVIAQQQQEITQPATTTLVSVLGGLKQLSCLCISNVSAPFQFYGGGGGEQQDERDVDAKEEYRNGLTVSVFQRDLSLIGVQINTLKLKGKYTLFNQLLMSLELLPYMNRLSLTDPLENTHHIDRILQSKSLVRLSANFNNNNSNIKYFLQINSTIKYLKVYHSDHFNNTTNDDHHTDSLQPILQKNRYYYNEILDKHYLGPQFNNLIIIFQPNKRDDPKHEKKSHRSRYMSFLMNIIRLLSEYECRYHRYEWNPLSLSLISHYWLVNIIARSTLRITTLDIDSSFIINYPLAYQRSHNKLLDQQQQQQQQHSTAIDKKTFNISKLTLIYKQMSYTESLINSLQLHRQQQQQHKQRQQQKRKTINWVMTYNQPLETHWSTLSIAAPFNNDNPFKVVENPDWFKNIEALTLDYLHKPFYTPWERTSPDHRIPIDLAKFQNISKLKLNHVYHRIVHAMNTTDQSTTTATNNNINAFQQQEDSHLNTIPILINLKRLAYLSINNIDMMSQSDSESNDDLLAEYDHGKTAVAFSIDLEAIGYQLHTLKLKGKYTLFSHLFSSGSTVLTDQLINLKRLSITTRLDKEHIDLIHQCKSLVRLSASFNDTLQKSVKNRTEVSKYQTLKVVDSNSIFSLINLIWNWILRQSILSSRFPDFLEILEYDIDRRINNIV
ncbi:hypothetical protein PPL_06747 [Heterostelium album PN500]|uniref:Uncharacterized protein n=1 Tax=Heterostelium pallidum (strain ATCC 26659 / Pp 5 / PN500) TaxID=670386 RepID=D3BFL3_HETP5|nr:hypothetical protein PPL_06747 [Heterostelium album PN500]EFA79927.1 hypothetical protein PPL_06747 [Heterostelium album PN500]|eukprot:XP_020432047.1 hypothetical protein PPL_06747 [Heterostelium album PN500]